MRDFLDKLLNLGYEFFGIVLPGAIALFAVAVPFGIKQEFRVVEVYVAKGSEFRATGLFFAAVIACYLCGHILKWWAKEASAPSPLPEKLPERLNTLWRWFLKISVLGADSRPEAQCHDEIAGLLGRARKSLGLKATTSKITQGDWLEFAGLAKSHVRIQQQVSLLNTYQAKYTLHRSLSAAFALAFWVCLLAPWFSGKKAPGILETALWAGLCAIFVWVFKRSYLLFWRLWGDTLITEVIALDIKNTNG